MTALVSGTDVYEIAVRIKPMPAPRWRAVVKACAGKIDSVVELLAGRFDESVMAHVCRQGTGLFPAPAEITYACTCPDGARGGWLCKHVAATLYGVGVRLDEDPALLFRLRRVAHADLIARATAGLTRPGVRQSGRGARRSPPTGSPRCSASSSRRLRPLRAAPPSRARHRRRHASARPPAPPPVTHSRSLAPLGRGQG